MLNIIVIVFSAMGLVGFGGLAWTYVISMTYDQALLDLYIIFLSGVGLGACFISLWEAITREWIERRY